MHEPTGYACGQQLKIRLPEGISGETQVRIHEYGEGGVNLPQLTTEP